MSIENDSDEVKNDKIPAYYSSRGLGGMTQFRKDKTDAQYSARGFGRLIFSRNGEFSFNIKKVSIWFCLYNLLKVFINIRESQCSNK